MKKTTFLKELVIEAAVLAGLVLCMLFFVPYYLILQLPLDLLNLISILGFTGLIAYSVSHVRRLLNSRKKGYAVFLTAALIATIVLTYIFFWVTYQRLPA